MEIKNVIICGLGALGLTYANKLKDICNLKILADSKRIENYKKNPPIFNDKPIKFDYITPKDSFYADLIIITTKSTGLDSAIEYLRNFITTNTIIISLINGISSEEKISQAYPTTKVLRSYFIGHSAIGENFSNNQKKYYQDGIGKIVLEPNNDLEKFFKNNSIDFEISNNISYSLWLKLGVNIILNELTAINKCTVGELRKNPEYLPLAKNLLKEVKEIAKAHGIKNLENYEQKVLESANLIADNGKTSMYQDILARKKTEVDIFSGEIIRLGNKYGIKTPYNEEIYSKIKLLEKEF